MLPAIPVSVAAQKGPPRPELVEKMTAPPWPTIALNHLGFRPRTGEQKQVRGFWMQGGAPANTGARTSPITSGRTQCWKELP